MRSLILVALTLCGCRQVLEIDPPNAAPDDGYRSGTRLKMMWNDYAGVRDYTGVYDASLDMQCSTQLWSDGNTYCTPLTTRAAQYLDPECTMPIGFPSTSNPCAPPTTLYLARVSSCGTITNMHLYVGGAPLSPQPAMYYSLSNGVCEASVNTTMTAVSIASELTPPMLVQQILRSTPGARLVQQVYDGTDGSEVRGPVQDTMLGACTPGIDGCTLAASATSYLDATCTTPVTVGSSSCPAPPFGVNPLHPSCADPGNQYYPVVGAALDNTTLYQLSNGICTSFAVTSGASYYALAPQPVSIVPLTKRLGTSSGQIVRTYLNDGTSDVGSLGLYDTVNHTPCATIGGHCLPTGVGSAVSEYSDASCMTPALFEDVYAGVGCAPPAIPPYFVYETIPESSCTATYQVFTTGSSTTQVYAKSATCTLQTNPSGTWFNAGPEVQLTNFATATSGIDP